MRAYCACVGEEDVQPAVGGEGFVHDGFHGGFVGGVEGFCVRCCGRVEGLQLGLEGGEVCRGEVAEVDRVGAGEGVLVRCCAPDAVGG